MAASPHASLGPLPVAPHHRRPSRRSPGRAQRLFAAAVLGLTLPLAAASAAVALPSPGALPLPAAYPSPDAGTRAEPGGGPAAEQDDEADDEPGVPGTVAAPPRRPLPRPHPAGNAPQAHRHHLASLPERSDAAVEQAPDQAPEQLPDQAADQAVEQAPEQAPDQAAEQTPEEAPDQAVGAEQPEADGDAAEAEAPGAAAVPDPAAANTAEAVAGQPVAAVAGVPALFPARWQDASTTQLPLGVGLGLIGCGLGLVGLRLRKD
ncbi:hypothetical protein ACFY4B_24485 [Kitasatospora sp. NPDC001261]|uniref:hypothetical protein n=1 Tax=Kitasatospora sp. NPDC001261 TaxID=3364012 RepID=UPI00369E985A